MKTVIDLPDGFRVHMAYVETLMTTASSLRLEDLENAVHVAKMRRMERRLNATGFQTMISRQIGDQEVQFNLVLVYDPSGNHPGEWATLEECRRLLDTVANLPPAVAYDRWRRKIVPVHTPEYTQQDAIADTRSARAELRQRAEEPGMSVPDYALEYALTSFMDLVSRR